MADSLLERLDAYFSRRPIAFIGFVLIVFGVLVIVSPQHQLTPGIVFLSLGSALDVLVISVAFLLSSRRKRREQEVEPAQTIGA